MYRAKSDSNQNILLFYFRAAVSSRIAQSASSSDRKTAIGRFKQGGSTLT